MPSARVRPDWPIDSRITLPPPNTASSPPAARGSGPRDLDEQVGVGEPDPVAGGRPVQRGVAAAVDASAHAAVPVEPSGSASGAGRGRCGRRPAAPARPPVRCRARSAPRCRRGRQPHARGGVAVEQPAPGWPRRSGSASPTCTGRSPVFDDQSLRLRPGRRSTRSTGPQSRREYLAGDHGIGWCTVTSLVPSGNVASTCTRRSSPARRPSRRPGEHALAARHQLDHGAPVARSLEHPRRDRSRRPRGS